MNIIKKLLTDYKIFKIYMIIQILLQTVLVQIAPRMGFIGNAIISLWAAAIIIYDYFHDRILFSSKFRFVMYLFVLSVLFSIGLNRINISENLQTVVMLIIEFFVLFNAIKMTKEDLHKDLFWSSNILGFTLSIGSLIGFILYCSNVTFYKYTGRYCGIYSNPNIASVLSLIGVVLSILALCYSRNIKSKYGKIIYKALHILSVIFNFVMFTFANSNNGKFMMILFFSSLTFVVCLLLAKFKNILVNILLSLILSVTVGICSFFLFNFMQQTFSSLPTIVNSAIDMIVNKRFPSNDEKNDSPTQTFDRIEDEKIDNGRLVIWNQGLKAYIHAPLFGFGPRNIFEALSKYNETVHVSVDVGGLHNMFFELLVSTGAVGFLIFMVFIVGIIVMVIKYLFAKSSKYLSKRSVAILAVLTGSVVMLIAMNLGESIMLFSTSPYSMLLWLLFGYLYNYVRLGSNAKISLPERKGLTKWI